MRLIDADALIAEWYKLNDIGPEDCGARFVGYQEIARLINNAPTVSGHGDYISRADAIEAIQSLYYTDRKKVLEALKALPSADAVPFDVQLQSTREVIDRFAEDRAKVVRCKDCRHRDLFSCPLADNDFQKDEDFCSWGERREPSK